MLQTLVAERIKTHFMFSNFSSKIVPFMRYSLTHSMVQSPSSETNWFAASQEISRI